MRPPAYVKYMSLSPHMESSSVFMSATKRVYVSVPKSRTDLISVWYRCTLVLILRELQIHTLCREFITEQASSILRSVARSDCGYGCGGTSFLSDTGWVTANIAGVNVLLK